jgi:hypothetical protein
MHGDASQAIGGNHLHPASDRHRRHNHDDHHGHDSRPGRLASTVDVGGRSVREKVWGQVGDRPIVRYRSDIPERFVKVAKRFVLGMLAVMMTVYVIAVVVNAAGSH